VRLLPGAAGGVQLPHRGHARGRGDDDRHQRLPELRAGDLPRLRHQLRTAGGAGDPGAAGLGDAGAAARVARLRGGGHVRAGRGHHPARRGVAADAGDPAVPAVRSRHHRRAHGGARGGRRGRRRHMSAAQRPPVHPAGLLRRYLGWSLDMVVPALAALALCGTRIDGVQRAAAALDALARSLMQAMVDMMVQGSTPLALARAWLADPVQREAIAALSDAITAIVILPLLLASLLSLLWFAAFEASPRRATPGKRALGLRVEDARGARIGFSRAALRHLAGTLSWLTLNLGHLLAALPPRRQALHDRIAGTRVLQELPSGSGLPAWSLAWLGLQILLAVFATAGLFLATQA